MADVGAVLLRAALQYARARVEALLEPQALAAALGVELPDVDPARTRLVAALGAARGEVTALPALLTGPATVAGATAAAPRLTAAVTHLREAAAALGVTDDAGLTRLLAGAPTPGGVVRQLGLTAPAGLRVEGTTLVHTMTASAVTLPGIAGIERVALRAELTADGRFTVGVELTGVGLDLGGAAGPVVGAVLGAAGLSVVADLALGIDTARGLTARGSLGPVALPARSPSRLLEAVSARLVVDGPVPGVELTARSAGGLGSAVRALLDGFGLHVPIDLAEIENGGSPILAPQVKAPDSIGLAVAAGPVSGGGFLSVQPAEGGRRFSGALDLRLGPVAVTAFGVLTERGDGFSLVLVLSVRFTPPLEVALGFTLNGVGGLVGIDVRVDTDVLRGQLRSGVLERLLFPPDPVAAAPTILATLASVFPPSPGGFVVGPLLSLGWGRPTSFVRLDLAVVLALPDPTVLLLARLRVAVPAPEAPLLDLRAEVYGEFSARRVLVVASLADSRIAAFDVSGDVGLLTRFGDDATFALSAGGFHPRFAAPPELADLRRVAVELSPPLGLSMRVEGYVAVTTNTLQLGGRVEAGYSAGVAGVHGYLALDALLTFDPFAFEVDIAAGVAVEVLGFSLVSIDLALHLSGPAPWRVHGTGRVNLPWPLPDPSISLGPIEWGEGQPPSGPTVSPAELVATALSAPGAWTRVDAPGRPAPVTLRTVEPAADEVLVEPWALLRGTQTAVPLDTRLDRVGSARVAPGEDRVLLGDPTVGAAPGARWSVDEQAFPLGQYVDLTDDVALAAPSFERRAAGLVVDPGDLSSGTGSALRADRSYETSYPGEPQPRTVLDGLLAAYDPFVTLAATSAGRSGLRTADRYAVQPDPVAVAPSAAVRVVATDALPGPDRGPLLAWSDGAAALGAGLRLVGAGV